MATKKQTVKIPEAVEASTNGDDPTNHSVVEEHNKQTEAEREKREQSEREQQMQQARDELEKLEPSDPEVRWVIGKPPQEGGKETEYSVYVQRKLDWLPKQRFFALVARSMSKAIKSTGGEVGGLSDVFGNEDEASLVERGRRLTQRDFKDAASFFALAMELVAETPDFLVDCYMIWLNVPARRGERAWAREVLQQPWRPEEDIWGLKDEDHEKLINTFIDQNYEDIRAFFVEKVPAMGKRVMLHERSKLRKARRSESDQ
jgi:hypothetical protein